MFKAKQGYGPFTSSATMFSSEDTDKAKYSFLEHTIEPRWQVPPVRVFDNTPRPPSCKAGPVPIFLGQARRGRALTIRKLNVSGSIQPAFSVCPLIRFSRLFIWRRGEHRQDSSPLSRGLRFFSVFRGSLSLSGKPLFVSVSRCLCGSSPVLSPQNSLPWAAPIHTILPR